MASRLQARVQTRRFRDAVDTAFVGLLLVAEHLGQRLDEICSAHGITHAQYNVLRILRGAPAGHPRYEIASRLIQRAPDVTRLLDRLDRQGLITRGWAPDNRRHSIARITAKGLHLLDAIDPALRDLQHEALRPLTAREVTQLAGLLDRLTA